MKATVTYKGKTPHSFVAIGDRTRWHFEFDDGIATFERVEVDKDDHSTETTVVLFGSEWHTCMEFVKSLEFVDEIQIAEPIE